MKEYGVPLKVYAWQRGSPLPIDGVATAVLELVTYTLTVSMQLRIRPLVIVIGPLKTKVPDDGSRFVCWQV